MNLSEEQKLKLKEIKKRLNATTPGYWERECDKIYEDFDDDPTIISDKGLYICQTTYDFQSPTMEHNVEEDTVFITNAKNDIEYLLNIIDKPNRGLRANISPIDEVANSFAPVTIKELEDSKILTTTDGTIKMDKKRLLEIAKLGLKMYCEIVDGEISCSCVTSSSECYYCKRDAFKLTDEEMKELGENYD